MRKDRHYSRRQLEKNIRKMGEIIMIGAISSIEESFGELWGHNKEDNFLPEEEEMYNKWDELRKDILNKGNKNIEYMISLLDNFRINMYKDENRLILRRKINER